MTFFLVFRTLLIQRTDLLDGLLPVLICAPPTSPSEQPRKIYHHTDGTDNNSLPAEVSTDNHRTTRSAGAAATTSSKAAPKKSSSMQPQQCPEIHMFSSKSRITEDSEDDIVELSPPDHAVTTRTKKRPLPDDGEVVMEEKGGRRGSLQPLYDSDSNTKTATKRVRKSVKKQEMTKKNVKWAAEVVRGGRGGRSRGGKAPGRVVKSRAVISSDSANSDVEVPGSDPAEAPLAPPSRPKPKPAYTGANSTVTKSVEISMSATAANVPSQSSVDVSTEFAAAAAQSQPTTDVSTESSVTTASDTPIHAGALTMPSSQQGPMPQDPHNIVPTTSANQGLPENSVPTMQVASSRLPQALPAVPGAAPTIGGQGGFVEAGLLPPGDFHLPSRTTWDSRLAYTDSSMQRDPRVYAGYRDPRFDPAGHGTHSRLPGVEGWDVGGPRDIYRHQDRHRGYEDAGWDAGHRDEYREVRRGGREEAAWDVGGQEEYWELRRVGREGPGWAMGGRHATRHLPEVRHIGREAPLHEESINYGATYDMADYGGPSPYGQGVAMRQPSSTYPASAMFNNNRDYLHLPPPPPPSRSSDTSASPFGFQDDLQQVVPNVPAAPSTTDNAT